MNCNPIAIQRKFFLPAALLLCCGPLLAQEDSSDSIQWSVDLEDVVVTAQYAPTSTEKAVHDVTVLKAPDLQRQGFNNLAEVLSQQINLRVDADPILGNGLSMQGIGGENIQVMIDGVPVIGRLGGSIDLSQISLADVARVEIIQGALSAQYGSDAAGGVINIITRRSQLQLWQLEGQSQWESLDINNQQLAVGRRMGKLWVRVSGNWYRAQFAPEDSLRLYENVSLNNGESIRRKKTPWNPKEQIGVSGSARYHFSDSTKLYYRYSYFDEALSIYGEARRPQFQPYAFDENYITRRQDHSLQLESRLTSGWYLQSTTAYNQYDRASATLRRDLTTDTTSLVPGEQDTTLFTALLHRSILSTDRDRSWNVMMGVEALYETAGGDRIIDENSSSPDQVRRANFAAWAGLRLRPASALTLETNLRYGYNSKYRHPLIPSFNLMWTPAKRWVIRTGYAHGFRAPSLKELYFNFIDINHYIVGNTGLEAEHARNATVSAAYKWKLGNSHQLALTGKLFYNKITDRIVLAEYEPLHYNYQNLDRFETHGFQMQLAYKRGAALALSANFAYTRLYNTFVDGFVTERFVPLPEMQNELRYRLPLIRTDLNVQHRFIGRQVRYYQEAGGGLAQGFVGHYHLLHATLSRNFWQERLLLAAGVKNLFDQSTVALSGGSSGEAHSSGNGSQLVGFGRTFFVRMQLNFGFGAQTK